VREDACRGGARTRAGAGGEDPCQRWRRGRAPGGEGGRAVVARAVVARRGPSWRDATRVVRSGRWRVRCPADWASGRSVVGVPASAAALPPPRCSRSERYGSFLRRNADVPSGKLLNDQILSEAILAREKNGPDSCSSRDTSVHRCAAYVVIPLADAVCGPRSRYERPMQISFPKGRSRPPPPGPDP